MDNCVGRVCNFGTPLSMLSSFCLDFGVRHQKGKGRQRTKGVGKGRGERNKGGRKGSKAQTNECEGRRA